MNKILSDMLIDLRKINGLSQQQVAALINVNRSTYAYYETGKSNPKLDVLQKIAAIYGKTVDELLGKNDIAMISAPPSKYASGWNADTNVSQLSDFEKAVLLKLRLMNFEEKTKLLDYIENEIDKK